MGALMAGHILAAGHPLTVFDVRAEAAETLVERGAQHATSPRAIAGTTDALILSLPTPAIVEQIVFGEEGIADALRPGSCLIDTSTNDPELTGRIGKALLARGVAMLEAPVTGGVVAADSGTLVSLVGGDAQVLERYRPILDLFCGKIFHLGDLGSGNTAKVITNLLTISNALIAAEGMILGRKTGLDLETLWQAISASVGRSFATDFYFPNGIFDGSFPVRFRLDLMAKDLGIVSRLAREFNVPMAIATLVEQVLIAARAQGLGSASNSAAVTLLEKAAGVELRLTKKDG